MPNALARDRARRHTARSVLRRIDDGTERQLVEVAPDPDALRRRLDELDREWDLDRAIEAEAAAMGLTGVALGALLSPRLLALPAAVGASVFLFATIGFYPLLPLFRRIGLRTAREIERERQALKVLRGDFEALSASHAEAAGELEPTEMAALRH